MASTKKNSKSTKTSTSRSHKARVAAPKKLPLSEAFIAACKRSVEKMCSGPDGVGAQRIADDLEQEFGVSANGLLKLMVSFAVSSGLCPGFANVRGKGGGIVNVAAREAWNARIAKDDAQYDQEIAAAKREVEEAEQARVEARNRLRALRGGATA